MKESLEVERRIEAYDYPPAESFRRRHLFQGLVALGTIFTLALAGAGLSQARANGLFQNDSTYISEHFVPMSVHSGRVGLTVIGLTNHKILPSHGGGEYWLGSKDGYSYTTSCVIAGELKVTYLPPGVYPSPLTSSQLSVTVYENQKYFDLANKSYDEPSMNNATNNLGDTLSFDGETRITLKVALFSSAEVVLIKYPSQQSVASLLADSMKLQPVSPMKMLG